MLKKILFSLAALYGGAGFIVFPLVLESQIPKSISNQLNVKLSIKDITFNPFLFKLNIFGLELRDLKDEKLASLDALKVDAEPRSLLNGALHVKNMTLLRPQLFLLYDKESRFNFGDLVKTGSFKEENTTQESGGLLRIIVDKIALEEGRLLYRDLTNSTPFEFALEAIDFKATKIDTHDAHASGAKLRLNSKLGDGGFIDCRGDISSYKPFVIDGSLSIEATKLYTPWKYMQDSLKLEIADGKLFFDTSYHFNADDLNATTLEDLFLSLENLRIKPKNKNHDLLTLKTLRLEDVKIKPMQQTIYVKDLFLDSLQAYVQRDTKGAIEWVGYLENKQNKKESKEQKKSAVPWSVVVAKSVLKKADAIFEDQSLKPALKTKLRLLSAEAKNITLSGEEPFTYSADALLNEGRCSLQGSLRHKKLTLDSALKCSGLDVVHFVPYMDRIALRQLKTYDVALTKGVAGFDAHIALKDENSQIDAVVDKADFKLEDFNLARRSSKEKIVDFKIFAINNAHLDTKTKEASVESGVLEKLSLDVAREQDGSVSLKGLIEPKETQNASETNAPKSAKTEEKPYRVRVKAFDINGAKVVFDDKSIQKNAITVIEEIHVGAKNIDSCKRSRLEYALDMRINSGGAVNAKGFLWHTPLEQKGSFELKKISLKELTPYLQESTFLKISDGYLFAKGKSSYRQKGEKFQASADGTLSVEDFFLHDTRDESTVASFIRADLKSFRFDAAPNRLNIDEAVLDSFYVDAQINEDKSMNLAKLMKEEVQKEKKTASKKSETKERESEKLGFKLLNLRVTNGSANFADYSLPIDFKTSIHDLNGNLYAISSAKDEVSYVDIDGMVDEYGSAKLKGSVEASDFKSYTDLNFNFRNLNLNAFSGYSAQFAGYKIDEGKLFLDLEYKIYDSALLGKNSLIIKKIKLGDEIKDENITKLPLGFAVALLEDSEGVIDIDMPVEGDISKPDFKYGAMVLKTFAGFIVKAVASPFKFLGAAMGIRSDELEFAEFEASEFLLLPPEREKLDNIAKMLHKKPALSLKVSGGFDAKADKEAIQAKKLTQELLAQNNNASGITIKTVEDLCIKSLGKEKIELLKSGIEQEYKKGLFKAQYQKMLLEECTASWSVSDEEFQDLADKRADTIAEYLVKRKKIEPSRVIVEKVKEREDSKGKWVKTALKIDVR